MDEPQHSHAASPVEPASASAAPSHQPSPAGETRPPGGRGAAGPDAGQGETRQPVKAAGFTTSTALKRRMSGLFLSHPWFDSAGLWLLRRAFFPVSRAWAAAGLAGGDLDRFHAAVPLQRRFEDDARLKRALADFEAKRAATTAIDALWERTFFGPDEEPEPRRRAIEQARLSHAHAFNLTRRHFAFLLPRRLPRIDLRVATPAETAKVYGAARDDLAPFVAAPAADWPVQVSARIPGAVGTDFWLRFKSPSARLGDMVHARVHEPIGVTNPPTVILGHGVCVEFDHWIGLVDEADALTAAGFRVIRPEAPFHGWRCPDGAYGGERLIGDFPLGALDAFTGALREWAVLARWARATSRGRLAFGGTSLGALTAQLAADRAREWPEDIRPDGLLLITHSGSMHQTVLDGAITRLFASAEAAEAKGWTAPELDGYFGLLDPRRDPLVPPERIVSILGKRDVVTPYVGGAPLVERWKVPPENLFELDRGHFSVPMTMIRDNRAVRRFCEVMGVGTA